MATDDKGELDIDKTVDGIVDEILPSPEPLPEDEVPPNETPVEEETPPETPPKEEPPKKEEKPEPKEGEEGYVPPTEPKAAPKSWSKEMAPEFGKLPAPIQEYIHKREEDFTNGISQYKQAAEYGLAVNDVVAPYLAHIKARGVDVPTALQFLLNADYVLTNSDADKKAAYFSKLLQDYNVDPSKLGVPQEKSAEVRALEERLSKTEGSLTEYQRSQMEQRRAEVVKAVDAFAADPKNVYFAELSDDIVKFINAGDTLEEAYQRAVWANPVTRAKELARTSKEKDEAARKAAEEAAAKAKRATRSNVKETPSDKKSPTGILGSMDDTIRSTLRTIQERSS